MPAVLPVGERSDRFSGAIELDSHLRIGARVIDQRVRARIDIYHRSAHGVSATIAVCLLIPLNVSSALQIRDQIFFGNILARANLFWRSVDAGRARENFSAQEIIESA